MDEILFTHICEVIFKNTNDLIILEKLKRVNILWKNSIDKILETSDIWKRACLNEIPSEPIPFMITRFFPMVHFENYHELDDLKVWRTVYFSYRKWKILSKLRVSVEVSYQPAVISNRPEGIWAFASNDKYFAVGNSRGIIYLFDFNRLNEPVQTINFEKIIKNIKFWSPASGDLFIVARIEPGNIKFWNVSAMTEVECINSNDDTRIDVLCTGSPNILFTINNRRLYEYKHTTDGIRLYRIDNLQLPLRTVTGSVENDKIIYVSTDEDSVTFYNYRNQTSYGNHNIIEEDHQIFPAWSNNNIHPYDSPTQGKLVSLDL
ncbi:uncharacterized protein LOC130676682 isoform X2 [Microplitis mediator]|uniref:uncharacterized protein LOC130676682 isoform X2 n=1 Tax=Microplitis mediator TaxID=375433 RepID=UPI002557C64D|nr:uncharacterized protein LOC130676682 isoform X2 [Microplitis mediator]